MLADQKKAIIRINKILSVEKLSPCRCQCNYKPTQAHPPPILSQFVLRDANQLGHLAPMRCCQTVRSLPGSIIAFVTEAAQNGLHE